VQNVDIKVDGDTCVITLDLSKRLGPSKSEKTTIVASTGGNVEIPGTGGIKVGLNVFVPVKK